MSHIAVIGAGITGVTTAFQLHKRGMDVTVFDRHRYPAMETSFANGGQLSASNAEVWNTWTTVFKGIKWMLQSDAPLLVNPKPSWHKFSWMAEFLMNIPKYRKNTIETARMAVMARKVLLDMAEHADVDFDFSPAGIMHFYKNEKDLAHGRKVTDLLAQGGVERRELTANEVREIEPTLKGDITGGFWTEADATGDIHKYTVGLATWLEKQGVTFAFGEDVSDVLVEQNKAKVMRNSGSQIFDAVVVSAGVASRDIAKSLGDRVNIYPVKGYSITVNMPDQISQDAAPNVSLLDDNSKVVTARLGPDRLRIAGTAEFNGANRDIRADRIAPLARWCETHFPAVSTENAVPWAGLRPMMPNMMPHVGRGKNERVFYNTGHGHLGWTLSSLTADIIAECVQGAMKDKTSVSTGGFHFKSV
ncbi:D-amino acid dehydrogenase [Parasulfitobacter algicola]|uniref:D-amino acid dehydrogenase n=1 Tax=Parasulfitobacter algicola TaxID=2614809 RepID=A0ABX2INH5_9RHOB|nr:D-amino acid dehydrogenase [Sulfitobacter algicola]NSX53516.1 D-amino acid dehydrogenase [Sulfitobacter algicola]